MKAWFVSDIHITDSEDPRLQCFESFLRERLTDGTTHLFLVGDIFDLWVGGHEFFAKRYEGVVNIIRQLRTKSIEIIYFEGNHDLHLQGYWADELNCRVAVMPEYFDLGKFRVRVEHGDEMNPDDKGYLFLRTVLRTAPVENLVHVLPGSIIQGIGNRMSRSSRKYTSSSMKERNDQAIQGMIRTHALKVFESDEPFDLIISGHVHTRDDFAWKDEATGRDVRSINLGCWLKDQEPQALCLDAGGARFVTV